MHIVPCLNCHQHIITVSGAVKHIHTVKVKIHDLDLIMILPDVIPKHIHIMTPVPVHQHQPLAIQILNSQPVFTGKTMMDGYRAADRLSGNFKSCTASQIQHRVIKNPCNYVNVLPQIFQNFPGILRRVFIGVSWNLISGHNSWILGQSSTKPGRSHRGCTMRITFSPSCMAFFARMTESLQYWITYFASLYRDIPAFVSVSPR